MFNCLNKVDTKLVHEKLELPLISDERAQLIKLPFPSITLK